MGLHLGIDLGTTNSAAATFDGERLSVVRAASGGVLTPSVVRIDARGNLSVGARARRMLETDPENTRAEFKRLMGSSHRLSFKASGQEKRPEELSAAVLSAIRQDFAEQHGTAPARAVISVPALFELAQTSATSEAARIAGFERVEMIQEPVASAIAAGWRADGEDPRPWLVYDLGGGTFDASLLETQEGMLRVVGHDGDNFLGGRDLDQAIVDWALAELAGQGLRVDPADPRHAGALRRLRYLAEEAKIELARAREAAITAPGLFALPDGPADVDLLLDRATLDRLVDPLIERSLAISLRLLARHGLRPGELGEVVLVGGPTVMSRLRERVASGLGASLRVDLDPMTLVAQGAALFAASAGLDARAAAPVAAAPVARGPAVWLQYPSMSADPTPYVVGRVLDAAAKVEAVRVRSEGWQSPPEPLESDGSFALMVQLRPRGSTAFTIEGLQKNQWVALNPSDFSMVHGLTLQDPPLSRSIGVALADDTVRVFFERGSPLPMRRTFTLSAVQTVHPGGAGDALRVPVVQGELPQAHLCRLVGTLLVPARELKVALPVGSPLEITLDLDRGGRLRATAKLPGGQLFEQVAELLVPTLAPEAMTAQIEALTARLNGLRADVFRRLDADGIMAVNESERGLEEARRAAALARGGDPDAAERARRALLEVDAALAGLESRASWPAVEQEAQDVIARATIWVGRHGTPDERALLSDATARLRRALAARGSAEIKRLQGILRELSATCWLRHPGAWEQEFHFAASRVSECADLRAATRLVERGQAELRRRDEAALERTVYELWDLLPADAQKRRLSFDSGVR